jgi:hypothetical protein
MGVVHSQKTAPNTAAHGTAWLPTSPRVVANITMLFRISQRQHRALLGVCVRNQLVDAGPLFVAQPLPVLVIDPRQCLGKPLLLLLNTLSKHTDELSNAG